VISLRDPVGTQSTVTSGEEGLSGDTALLVNQTEGGGGRGVVWDPSTQLAHFLSSKRHKLDDILTL